MFTKMIFVLGLSSLLEILWEILAWAPIFSAHWGSIHHLQTGKAYGPYHVSLMRMMLGHGQNADTCWCWHTLPSRCHTLQWLQSEVVEWYDSGISFGQLKFDKFDCALFLTASTEDGVEDDVVYVSIWGPELSVHFNKTHNLGRPASSEHLISTSKFSKIPPSFQRYRMISQRYVEEI